MADQAQIGSEDMSSRARNVEIDALLAAPRIEKQPLDWVGLGAALVTVVLWASAFVGIRAATQELSPGALAFGRLLLGSVVLGAFVFFRREALPRGRDLALVVAAGVLWFGAYNVALNTAEQLVDAGTAAMLVGVAPLGIVIFAGFALHEGFPPRLLVGSATAFVGTIIIGFATMDAGHRTDAILGVGLCLVAAFVYAIGVVLEKPVLGRVSGLSITWVACFVGALVTLPFAPQLLAEIPHAAPSGIAALIYLAVFPTSVAFLTWAVALGRSSAGRMGSTLYLVAPSAIAIGWVVLGEAPPPLAIGGGLLSIVGVVVARSRPRRRG